MTAIRAQVSNLRVPSLHFVLLETVLPDRGIRSDAILTEVDQDVHGSLLHRLAHVEVVIIVVRQNLLDGTWRTSLESLGFLVFARSLESLEDFLEVLCEENISDR
jgi:hypothetical protein